MASRKEHKEKLRREREERERAAKEAEQRRRLIGYGAAGVLVVGALVALALVFLERYGTIDAVLQGDLDRLSARGIPVDIVFQQ